jgi:hypothetical protein
MKRPSLVLLSFLLAPSLFADAGQHLIPAGSLIGCTLSEPRLSSKTAAVGDPVMCRIGHSGRYGGAVLPYNSFLVGQFEDYKDPGHFVGKGWMELRFDRMVIEPDTVIPIDARVVDVPGYRVDNKGRILGKGHATRDVVLWTIPILWPIDLLMLPMRGPRPTLKEETRLTLKMMDDLPVPATETPQMDPYGLMHRESGQYNPPPAPAPQPAPQTAAYAPVQQAPPPTYAYPAPVYAYAPVVYAPPPVFYMPMVIAAPPPVVAYSPMPMVAAPAAYGYGYGYGYAQPPGYPTAAYRPNGYAYSSPPPAYPTAAYRPNGYGYSSTQTAIPARQSAYQMASYGGTL